MRVCAVAATVVALGLLAACSSERPATSERSTSRTTPVPRPLSGPTWTPLDTAAPAARDPVAPSGLPSLAKVAGAATRGSTRVDGEQFAVLAAQLLLDVRPRIAGEDVLRLVAAPTLDPKVRAYLVGDIDGQQAIGTARAVDTNLGSWIRSRVVGTDAGPDRLDVEYFCVISSAPLKYSTWTGLRIDLGREGGRWKMVAFSDGPAVPMHGSTLTAAERRQYLTGTGWRPLPPAR